MHLHHAIASQHSIIIIILDSAQHLSHPTIIRFGLKTPAFGKIDIEKNFMETSCASISCQLLVVLLLYTMCIRRAHWPDTESQHQHLQSKHKHYNVTPLLHPPASQTHQCIIYPSAVSNSAPFKRKFI